MATVNITKAAKLAGITRQYLHKHYIKQGKISVTQDLKGNPQIDTSEILRVFGKLNDVNDTGNSFQEMTPKNSIDINDFTMEVQLLRQEVAHQKILLEEKDKRLTDYELMVKLLRDKSPELVRKSFIHSLFSKKVKD